MTETGIGSDTAGDLALLRAYEPVVRFTAGELFFPTAVEPYVAHAALWEIAPDGTERCVVADGELTIERLVAQARCRPDAELSLRFVETPLDRKAYRAWRKRPDRPAFRSAGRFAKVGLISRVIDALFRLSLLLRGRVPGGLAAAAERSYRTELDPHRHPYYGRVVRDGGFVALQYWIFYAMNDWRSTFGGANDHEADWEQVTVYLADEAGDGLRPAWVAYSSHDYVGDDLRRRWDDPELVRDGDHPVVFAGAGSHSGTFVAGEYVTAVHPPGALDKILSGLQRIARLITPWSRGEIARGVGIPFVDYHRGDGLSVGPGADRPWVPALVGDSTTWVRDFRGLWGRDTRDRFGGERAPAGPRYERGGAVRRSWADPLGWAGLQKVPATRVEATQLVRERIDEIDGSLASLDTELEQRRTELRRRSAAGTSLRGREGFDATSASLRTDVVAGERELGELVAARAALADERTAHEDSLARPRPPEPAQAHLTRKVVPVGQAADTRARLLRWWSTISTPLVFGAAAWLVVDHRIGIVVGIGAFVVAFLLIEAIARGHLVAFVLSSVTAVVVTLVAVAVIQGVFGHWRFVVASLLAAFALAVLVTNLRDLRRG